MMKVFTIEEREYGELEESLCKVIKAGKKFLKHMEEGSFGQRGGRWRHDDEDDDYDMQYRRGGRY